MTSQTAKEECVIYLKELFRLANESMLRRDVSEMLRGVSERSICADLKTELDILIRNSSAFEGYYVDVEYNRGARGLLKAIVDTQSGSVRTITCDLILHSRGRLPQDNLLCLEMKKAYRMDKQKDKDRLISLTLPGGIVDVRGNIGNKTIVGDYLLGIYYEYDERNGTLKIEYYQDGRVTERETLNLRDCLSGGEHDF